MPDPAACRSIAELEKLVTQAQPHELIDDLARHLEQCERCAEVVDRLLAGDALARVVRTGAEQTILGPALRDLAQRLHELQPDFPPRPQRTVVGSDGSSQASDRAEEPLPTVPGYEVLALLGRGGTGDVYKARDVHLGRLVALKMIAECASLQHLVRFRAEAQVLAQLQHPHIVQIFEVNEHRGQPYFVLELLEGGSLDSRLARSPQPPPAAAAMVQTLARTMHAAHAQGVIHRDLKPSNVLLTRDGQPKIGDFGLAKRMDEGSNLTRTGTVMGTPSYMAPEQAHGNKDIGPAADIYALGAILYEMLTGRPPFQGASPLETLEMVRTAEPVLPGRLQAGIPRDLETICLKCLEKQPEKRYASAAALADDLERFLGDKPIAARRAGLPELLVKWARRRPAPAALVATIVRAVVLLGALGAWSNARLRQSARRAEARSRQVRAVVDDLYTRVAEEWLAEEPYKDALRQEFLEKALALYQELVEEGGRDPEVRRQAALASFRVGQIYRTLDQGERARAAYARAIAMQQALCDESPTNPACRQDLANSFNWLGELLRESGRPLAEAEPHYRKALELQEALVEQAPSNLELRRELARSCYNLAIVQLEQARLAEAAESLERAVTLLGRLREETPGAADVRLELARCLINRGVLRREKRVLSEAQEDYRQAIALLEGLQAQGRFRVVHKQELATAFHNSGNLLWARGDLPGALRALDRAVQLLQRLAEDFPDRPPYRKKLASTLNSRASVQATAKDWDGAEKTWVQSRDLLRRLQRDFPDVPDHARHLGITLGNLGWLRSEKKDWGSAQTLFEEAILHLHKALEPNPKSIPLLRALRTQYRSLAETRIQLGDHAAAAEAALALPKVLTDQPQDFYHAACFLARCVALARSDARLSQPARHAAADRYASHALAHLGQAARPARPPLERLTNEREVFRALAGHPDLERLLAQLPASAPR
jgi:serine/threonine-protein kinase